MFSMKRKRSSMADPVCEVVSQPTSHLHSTVSYHRDQPSVVTEQEIFDEEEIGARPRRSSRPSIPRLKRLNTGFLSLRRKSRQDSGVVMSPEDTGDTAMQSSPVADIDNEAQRMSVIPPSNLFRRGFSFGPRRTRSNELPPPGFETSISTSPGTNDAIGIPSCPSVENFDDSPGTAALERRGSADIKALWREQEDWKNTQFAECFGTVEQPPRRFARMSSGNN